MNRGGKREGAGRKARFVEKSTTISIRIPASKKAFYKALFVKAIETESLKPLNIESDGEI